MTEVREWPAARRLCFAVEPKWQQASLYGPLIHTSRCFGLLQSVVKTTREHPNHLLQRTGPAGLQEDARLKHQFAMLSERFCRKCLGIFEQVGSMALEST